MSTQLDPFETRLLAELREHVTVRDRSGRRPQRRWRPVGLSRLAVRAAAATAAIAAILVIPGLGTSPAYSVGEGNAGEIHVEINRPEDALGLERALEDLGIAADITYLSELQSCAPGRYTAVDRDVDITASIGERFISVTLAPDTVRSGETLVLAWSALPLTVEELEQVAAETGRSVVDGTAIKAEIDVATGPVAPCRPIPDE